MSSPSTIDSPSCSVDLLCVIAHQESSHFSDIVDCAELSWRLLFLNQFLGSYLLFNVVPFRNNIDLFLDQRCQDPTWTDYISSDTMLGILQSSGLGKTDDSVLGWNIGAFVDRSNQTVDWWNIYDTAPLVLEHMGNALFTQIESWAQI